MTDLNYSDSSSLPKQKQIFAINHIVYPNCCHVAKGRNTKTLLSGRLFQELEGYLPRTSHTLSLECKVWNNPVLLSSLLFFSLLAWSWPRLSYYKANIFFWASTFSRGFYIYITQQIGKNYRCVCDACQTELTLAHIPDRTSLKLAIIELFLGSKSVGNKSSHYISNRLVLRLVDGNHTYI